MLKSSLQFISFILLVSPSFIMNEPPQFIKEGLDFFKQIKGDPNSLINQFYRANMLIRFQEFDHALKLIDVILKSVPNDTASLYNKGYLLKIIGRPAESIAYYKKVMEMEPSNIKAPLGISHAYLAIGDYEQGLPLFEYRLANPAARNYTPLNMQEISGKTIVIANEAFGGLGDWIMMIRFAKVLKSHGARVIAQAPEGLSPLFSLCPYLDGLTSQKKELPPCDKTILLMNLPLCCNTTLKTIPNKPYLFANEQLVTYWKNKIAQDTNFKIGLCWGEMPQTALVQTSAYGKRSMPLQKLAPLAKISGVSFYSLQKVDGMDQVNNLPKEMSLITFTSDFDESNGRFMDTAALMKNMDLVISLDTAPAHLAGALGITTWLYLPYAPEWRWMVDRTDSPWYPSMRLFRQHHPGNWDEVVQDMVNALPELILEKKKVQTALGKPATANLVTVNLLTDIILNTL